MDTKEIMQDNKIEIKYEESFVAFLDVLGFTDMVKNNNISKINTYLIKVEIAMSELKKILTQNGVSMDYIIISDSIIISIKQKNNTKGNINILRNLCTSISVLQSFLSYQDIWLRGAISSGEAYFNQEKNQIIGKAYINAYLLESKVSNPQVILDNKIIKELQFSNSKDFIDAINNDDDNSIIRKLKVLYNWENNSRIKKDFPLFIDYQLFPFLNDKTDQVKDIVKIIENNIYTNTNLYTKYKWLADYILSIIDTHPNKDLYDDIRESLEKL